MIAGLETVTSGSIRIGDREISQLPASKRGIGVGFESYALYPPMSVRENLLYGLKARKVKGAEQMVTSISSRLEMDDLMDLRPAGLSSGQKQRVALARALVRNPPVLLLDEPLSHLDASARQRVRRELKVLQREFGYTTIVVTHDQVEALSLADRLAVMDAGVVQQFGTPDEVFDDPANLFVAQFVGEPQINVLRGVVKICRRPSPGRDRFGGRVFGYHGDRRGRRHQGHRRHPAAGLHDVGRGTGPDCAPPSRTSSTSSSSALPPARCRAWRRASSCRPRAQEVYEPEQKVVISAPPERVYLFDTDTGERLR